MSEEASEEKGFFAARARNALEEQREAARTAMEAVRQHIFNEHREGGTSDIYTYPKARETFDDVFQSVDDALTYAHTTTHYLSDKMKDSKRKLESVNKSIGMLDEAIAKIVNFANVTILNDAVKTHLDAHPEEADAINTDKHTVLNKVAPATSALSSIKTRMESVKDMMEMMLGDDSRSP